jgi:accessory gene regulator B
MSLSERAAGYLIKTKNIEDPDQQEILKYGAEVFFSTAAGTLGTLLLAWALGLFIPVCFMLLTSLVLRKTAGGAHSAGPGSCFLLSVVTYLLLAYLAAGTVAYLQDYLFVWLGCTYVIALIVLYLKAPVETPQKPLSRRQKQILKKLSLVALTVIFAAQVAGLTLAAGAGVVVYATSLIILWLCLMLTAAGELMVSCFDRMAGLIKIRR